MVLLDVIPAVQSVLGWTGIGLMAAGLILVLAAQSGMGDSWPVRVDEKSAPSWSPAGSSSSRNPVFTVMALVLIGMAGALPGPFSVAAPLTLIVALQVQMQVRLIEQPVLLRTHGTAYLSSAARVGRFLPFVRCDR